MKKEHILALADLIEEQEHTEEDDAEGFTMTAITHDCGTPACIAGWAAWEALGRPSGHLYDVACDLEGEATDYLGINPMKADLLFYPPEEVGLYQEITPSQAAATLRHLAETGEVDWTVGGVK
ncbi:hypothetical protein FHT87_005217 [Rhizobium sp. BK316]|uniref:hypothetical protein n=1 Tax=Rhizobium sp. BK316 TaxID=2587053 RepID=UPI00161A5C40|nr:hypothetical protein [Rhizobium sp. BK316]MBB3411264.1 hypothetical protein [Rhizobium sp. BK316]